MGPRSALKSLREFSRKELKEKRADKVLVQRVKMESSFRRGKFPNVRIKKIEDVHYLVCAFHDDRMRVYFFGKDGDMRGAEDYSGEEKRSVWEEVSKGTKKVFEFTK